MKFNDLSQLEENFLKYIKESENRMIQQINLNNWEINENLKKFESKLNNIFLKNESISETITNQKMYINKIVDFDAFKNKANNLIISHEYKLNNLIIDLNSFERRYDKVLSDNLEVPGYIGNSCKFKTISDYLSYSISEMDKKKPDDEKGIKDLKVKYNNLMNSMISLNDKSIDKCKDYTNAMKNNVIEFIENKLKVFEEDRLKYKADMYNYNLKNEEKFIDFKNKINELKRGFDELNEKYNQKMDEIYNINNIINEKIEKNIHNIRNNKMEIDILKNDIKAINENINNIKSNVSPKKTINATTNTPKNSPMTKYDKNKELLERKIKKDKIIIESNKNLDNSTKNKEFIEENNLQNMPSFFQTKILFNKDNKSILRNNTDNDYTVLEGLTPFYIYLYTFLKKSSFIS